MQSKRKKREQKTVEIMINIYCRDKHNTSKIRCEKCEKLYQYATSRIENCVYGNEKPVCAKCKRHCYKPDMREEIRQVMRYSGPKMLFRHPVLAIHHLIDSRRS